MAMNPRLMRPRASSAYHAEAVAWKTAVEANGGTVSTPTLAAVSTFCTAIDAAGIRDRFLRLNLLCGGNLAAARTPLYRGASRTGTQYGTALDTNIGPFVSGDYSEATGLTGNGSSKLLDTGLTIGTLATFSANYNNVHVSVYQRAVEEGPSFGGIDYMAAIYGNACSLDVSPFMRDPDAFFHTGSANYGEGLEAFGTSGLTGFHLADSTSAGPLWLRNNSSNLNSSASNVPQSFNSSDTTPLYAVGVYSNYDFEGGVVADPLYLSGTLAAYSVGKSFSATGDRTAFYNAMLAFQTALGRNV